MKRVLLEARSVGHDFSLPDATKATILEDINLELREDEFLALLGPSGSGKSTLLRILAGLIPPCSGQVIYRRSPVVGVCRGVSMVFQNFALYPWLTVRENTEIGLESLEIPAYERRRKAERAIDMVGLDGFEEAYPRELSGGMRQRVGLARALVVEPDVLLMDEPFSALDVLTAENLRRDLLELWIENRIPTRAIVMVTHGIEEAVYMADRALVLSKGPARIIADVNIDIPHWRDRDSAAFRTTVDSIYGMLTKRADTKNQQQPAQNKELQIPQVRAGAMTGLIELLEEIPGRTDLYRLGDELQLDAEDLLPIVEASDILGFARVTEGDIELTELGRKFALASVLERKEMFRKQAERNVPALGKILAVLRSKANRRMPREFFVDVFGQRIGKAHADEQLDTLIDWGRYAELLSYDEIRGVISLAEEA